MKKIKGKGDYIGAKHYNRLPDHHQPAEVAHAWKLDFLLWNTVKYISRAGHKESAMNAKDKEIDDLNKAIDYIRMRINVLEGRTPLDFGAKPETVIPKEWNWLKEDIDSFMKRWNVDTMYPKKPKKEMRECYGDC